MEGAHAAYRVVEAGEDELSDLTRMRLAWSADHGFAATDDFADRMRRWWEQQAGQRRARVVREVDAVAVGMANVAVFTCMPLPGVPDVHWAYVANVWVDPADRAPGRARSARGRCWSSCRSSSWPTGRRTCATRPEAQ